MRISPLSGQFGAVISAIDVRDLTAAQRRLLLTTANAAGVVVIRSQCLTEQEQLEFTSHFGRVRILKANPGRRTKHLPGIVSISNLDADGNIMAPDAEAMRLSRGNPFWHSDYSFTPGWSAHSILYAMTAATDGGQTEWARTEAAFDALPQGRKDRLSGLVVVHDLLRSRRKSGYCDFPAGDRDRFPPARHPLVTRHPETGSLALLLGAHACKIEDMADADAATLLNELTAFATQDRFVYSHRWRPGDLVIWDNRTTLHRGRPGNPEQPRVMRRTAVHRP